MAKMNGEIVLLDGSKSQVDRERTAQETLDYLMQLQPAGAAPFTDEDMAIYHAALERKGQAFAIYAHYAYVDYCYFFISAITDAREQAMEKMT